MEDFWWVNFKIEFVNWILQASFYFLDQQLWKYSETNMTLKNSRGEWIHGNSFWILPNENGEGYVSNLENNSLVLSLMAGKSAILEVLFYCSFFLSCTPFLSTNIDWLPKFATGLKCYNRHKSKSIWVTILSFCQNDSLMGESLWQKDRMVTHILFDLCLFKHFSPVANFGYQSLENFAQWGEIPCLNWSQFNFM